MATRDRVNQLRNQRKTNRPAVTFDQIMGSIAGDDLEIVHEDTFPGVHRPDRPDALIVRPDGSLQAKGFTLTTTGLIMGESATEDDWIWIGERLLNIGKSIAWLLGDWLAFGERVYGYTYKRIAEETGYDYQTLRDYVWVASNVQLSIRIDKLYFGHHRVVAPMHPDEQRYWLTLAVEHGWSVSKLKQETRTPDTGSRATAADVVGTWKRQALKRKVSRAELIAELKAWVDELEME